MANIYDVARDAGVSHTTVARVINGKGYVGAETRKKIEKSVKKLNYRPSEMAISLAKNKKRTYAIILPESEDGFYDWYLVGARSAHEELKRTGHQVEVYSFKMGEGGLEEIRKILKKVKKQKPEGLLVLEGFPVSREETLEMIPSSTKLISLSHVDRDSEGGIGLNQRDVGALCASIFKSGTGRGKILIPCGEGMRHQILERIDGFKAELKGSGLKADLQVHDGSGANLRSFCRSLLQGEDKYKGIFVPHKSAHVVCRAMEDCGYDGESLTIVGLDATKNNLRACKKRKLTFVIHQQQEVLVRESLLGIHQMVEKEVDLPASIPLPPIVIQSTLVDSFSEYALRKWGLDVL